MLAPLPHPMGSRPHCPQGHEFSVIQDSGALASRVLLWDPQGLSLPPRPAGRHLPPQAPGEEIPSRRPLQECTGTFHQTTDAEI